MELAAEILLGIIVFFAGAAVASFSGLIFFRLRQANAEQGIVKVISLPRSNCENCHRTLSWVELAPVFGWAIARGRCRTCGYKVSVVYPILEAILGMVSVVVGAYFMPDPMIAGIALSTLWVLVVIAVIDSAIHVIPEELTWFLLFLGLMASPFEPDVYMRIAGAAFGCGMMWLALTVTGALKAEDTAAGGDVALSAAIGAWLGMFAVPFALLLACVFFSVISLYRRKRGELWSPMGPALAASFLFSAPFAQDFAGIIL